MSYRSIAVHVDASPRSMERVHVAARMAAACQGRLFGIAPVGMVDVTAPASVLGAEAMISEWMLALRREAEGAAAQFREAVAGMGGAAADVEIIEGDVRTALIEHGRRSDLMVVGQADPADRLSFERRSLPAYVALNLGRPVLAVPYAGSIAHVGRRPIVAWNGTREAARALADALPLLKQAEAVKVLCFIADGQDLERAASRGGEAVAFLRVHGIEAQSSCERTDIDAGSALLSRAADWDADLIVMGAYGHARWREWILGGVTRTLLESMTVPVLMSH